MRKGFVEHAAREQALRVLGWRDTPVNADAIGRQARAMQPYIEQVVLTGDPGLTTDELERKLYVTRRRAEAELAASSIHQKDFFYIPSMSARTIVCKGLLLAPQIAVFIRSYPIPKPPARSGPSTFRCWSVRIGRRWKWRCRSTTWIARWGRCFRARSRGGMERKGWIRIPSGCGSAVDTVAAVAAPIAQRKLA